jgi:hypothetical protein
MYIWLSCRAQWCKISCKGQRQQQLCWACHQRMLHCSLPSWFAALLIDSTAFHNHQITPIAIASTPALLLNRSLSDSIMDSTIRAVDCDPL